MNAAMFPRALLMVFLTFAFPLLASAYWDVGVNVGFAPPELPVYEQPPCPEPGYIWTPGYWAYSNDEEDYFWVPGTWVIAPSPGLLWTPGYWAVSNGGYLWREGYWAPHVGFYGGINYGFGYFGVGFVGGYWRDRDFYYNRSVTNITNVNVTTIYNSTVVNDAYANRASFNGGGGVRARPTSTELIADREPHRGFTAPQRLQAQTARSTPELRASINHGRPSVAATARPGLLHGPMVTPARMTGAPSPVHRSAPEAVNHGAPSRGDRSAPVAPPHDYPSGYAVTPSRPAAFPPPPAHTGIQTAVSRESSMRSESAMRSESSMRNLSSAPALQRRVSAAPAYRPAPSNSAPPRESHPTPARQTFAPAPRSDGNFRNPPAARANEPAPVQERGAAGVQRNIQNAMAVRRNR